MLIVGSEIKCHIFKSPAAKIIGAPKRKENLAAVIFEMFPSNPAAIVIPDLDVPGNRASIWANPTIRICFIDNDSISFLGAIALFPNLSAARKNERPK